MVNMIIIIWREDEFEGLKHVEWCWHDEQRIRPYKNLFNLHQYIRCEKNIYMAESNAVPSKSLKYNVCICSNLNRLIRTMTVATICLCLSAVATAENISNLNFKYRRKCINSTTQKVILCRPSRPFIMSRWILWVLIAFSSLHSSWNQTYTDCHSVGDGWIILRPWLKQF